MRQTLESFLHCDYHHTHCTSCEDWTTCFLSVGLIWYRTTSEILCVTRAVAYRFGADWHHSPTDIRYMTLCTSSSARLCTAMNLPVKHGLFQRGIICREYHKSSAGRGEFECGKKPTGDHLEPKVWHLNTEKTPVEYHAIETEDKLWEWTGKMRMKERARKRMERDWVAQK